MLAKKNILLKRVLSIVMIVSMLCGCNVNTTVTVNGTDAATDIATDNSTDEAEQIVDPVEKEEPSELEIKDNDILYEDKDDTSILKMYLTVSSGNDADEVIIPGKR